VKAYAGQKTVHFDMVNKQDDLINRLIIIQKRLEEMEWSHNGIGADC
jgi:hypothetical protein